MSVSATDILQSSRTSEDRNQRKTERNDSAEGVFSMLMQKANLQQVASVGLANKLNFSFTPVRSAPADRPADPPPAQRRLDKDDDAREASSTRQDQPVEDAPPGVDPSLSLLLAARNVDPKAVGAVQAAANGSAATTANADAAMANAAQIAAARPMLEQTPASAEAGKTATLKANVTETPADLVSQPSNTLSATATVAAQAKSDAKTDPFSAGGAVETDESMINNVLSRAPGTVAAQSARQSHADANQPEAPEAGQELAPKVNATASPQTLLAATAARSAAEPQGLNAQPTGAQPLASAQGSGQSTAAQRTGDMPAPARARPSIPPRLVADQVAIQIQRAIGQGMDRIQIQLRPPELGRIDVRMEIGPNGHMKAAITADRQETLDLLQRDARHLQQALQDSGMSTDSGSLSFSLREESNDFRQQLAREGTDLPADGDDASQPDPAEKPRGRATDGNYDIEA